MTLPFLTVMHGDVRDLARLLLTFSPTMRAKIARNVIRRAAIAKAEGTPGRFGNGSIMAAARMYPGYDLPAEPFLDDPDYIDCWLIALTAIREAVVNAKEAAA